MVKLIELSGDSDTSTDQKAIGSKPVKLLSDDSVNSADVQRMVKSLGFQYHPSTKAQILIALIAEGIISEDIDRLREEVFNSKLVAIPTSNDNQVMSNEFDYSESKRGPPALVGSKDA